MLTRNVLTQTRVYTQDIHITVISETVLHTRTSQIYDTAKFIFRKNISWKGTLLSNGKEMKDHCLLTCILSTIKFKAQSPREIRPL